MDGSEWQAKGFDEPSSPLKSMANTANTLAVRQSHIGVDADKNFPDNFEMVQQYSKYARRSSQNEVNAIVQYPPDIISTTVERSTTESWGYQSGEAIFKCKQTVKNKDSKKRLMKLPSETSSNDSLNYESLKLQVAEEKSLAGSVSTLSVNSDGSRLTIPESVNVGVQSERIEMVNEYIQTSVDCDRNGETFELKRANAGLKGQLEQLDYVIDEMVKERSTLQMKIHSLEKELQVKNSQIEELQNSNEHNLNSNEELKSSIKKWEAIVNEYQEVIEAKTNEVKGWQEDNELMVREIEKLKIKNEHLKVDLESKINSIKEFENKIDQMSFEFKSILNSKLILEEEIKNIRNENKTLMSKNEWHLNEFSKLHVKFNEIQQKLIIGNEEVSKWVNENEKLQIQNSLLKQQLIEVRHSVVREKEQLMKNLEGIGTALIEKQMETELQKSHDSLKEGKSIQDENAIKIVKENEELVKDFEKMKGDLTNHSVMINELKKENENYIKELNNHKKLLNDKEVEINAINSYKSDLELKIKGINIDLKRQQEFNEILKRDKKVAEEKAASLAFENKSLESSTKQMKDTIEKYERNLKQFQSNMIAKETKIELLVKEKLKLNNTVEVLNQELTKFKQNLIQHEELMSYKELEIQKDELEKIVKTLNNEVRTLHGNMELEKMKFKQMIDELNKTVKDETKQKEHNLETIDNLKSEIELLIKQKQEDELKLKYFEKSKPINNEIELSETRIKEMIKLKDEKIRCLESNVKLLTKKYKEVLSLNKKAETESAIKVTTTLDQSIQTEDNESIKIIESHLMEMEKLKEIIKEKDDLVNKNKIDILNLEHEKGKLLSAGESYGRQHINSLETLISSKTEEITELNEKLQTAVKNYKDLEVKMAKKVTEVENDLKKEKALVKDLRHSIFNEKRENSYLKRDINELKKLLSDANVVADKRKQEVLDIESRLKKQLEGEFSLRSELEKLNSDLKYAREENFKLKNHIEENSHNNEPLLEQLKSLSLDLKEKDQEINALKMNLNATSERYSIELNSLNQLVDNYKNDINMLSSELSEVRKEKLNLRSKIAELKLALKNSSEMNKKLKNQLAISDVTANNDSVNEEVINQLLNQSYQTSLDNKPLVNLQACVQSLKQEMEILQKQINN